MRDPDETRLVDGARRGDRTAIDLLFERHWLEAWRAAYAISGSEADADDIAQEAFVKALRTLSGFDGRSSFRTWLHRIVANTAIDLHRAGVRRPTVLLSTTRESSLPEAPGGDGQALARLAELPMDQRAVVVLRYLLDFSLSEAAQLLGVPVGTVQSRASRGLATLRSQLGGQDG